MHRRPDRAGLIPLPCTLHVLCDRALVSTGSVLYACSAAITSLPSRAFTHTEIYLCEAKMVASTAAYTASCSYEKFAILYRFCVDSLWVLACNFHTGLLCGGSFVTCQVVGQPSVALCASACSYNKLRNHCMLEIFIFISEFYRG